MAKKEVLVCTTCSSTWSRKKTKGRKPKLCPTCIKEQVYTYHGSEVMPKQSSSTKAATKWICPDCAQSITVFVKLDYPPICNNPLAHTSKRIEMQINGRQTKIV